MQDKRYLRWVAAFAVLAFGALVWAVWPPGSATTEMDPQAPPIELSDVLAGEEEGFSRVLAPRALRFPHDHGPHPTYRSEWWYFTGNLATASGRRFGFQLTFFRFALTPRQSMRDSKWGAQQVYMAHLALSDERNRRFRYAQQFARGALGHAGAQSAPFRVWLHGWQAASEGSALFPLRLNASDGDWGVDLQLEVGKSLVLHGDRGFSRKSAEPGNASHYYSYTRLPIAGTIGVGEASHVVTGSAWLDREWSTSALSAEQAGWDWFALQLSDGRELMFYRLRRRDGSVDPFSAGTLVGVDGASVRLGPEEVEIDELEHWTSPRDGVLYPARWRLRIPRRGIDVVISPLIADQELDAAVRYWEGASTVEGTAQGQAVVGVGYVELTGYAGLPPGASAAPATPAAPAAD